MWLSGLGIIPQTSPLKAISRKVESVLANNKYISYNMNYKILTFKILFFNSVYCLLTSSTHWANMMRFFCDDATSLRQPTSEKESIKLSEGVRG